MSLKYALIKEATLCTVSLGGTEKITKVWLEGGKVTEVEPQLNFKTESSLVQVKGPFWCTYFLVSHSHPSLPKLCRFLLLSHRCHWCCILERVSAEEKCDHELQ